MANVVGVQYERTGKSLEIDNLGMREMQRRAYSARENKYILIKAPPASGKSRALMFLGLDKIYNQRLKKVIVSVPERTIGKSFAKTELKKFGFFTDWDYEDKYNLCTPGDEGKISIFKNFLFDENPKILICTHATLRHSYNQLKPEDFNNVLLAIDEFHHVSADEANILGKVLNGIMSGSTAHIVAMTGSYFRGDNIPVLMDEDEAQFKKVTYNYYEQLNGYKYLKSLGIGYHFYQGEYTSAVKEVLNTDQKTIIHIPHSGANESLKDKSREVGSILDVIGEYHSRDPKTGIIFLKRKKDNKIIKVADLVTEGREREQVLEYLRNMSKIDDVDIIIAMAMAIEGFDWPFCEHALTIGYRASLTQVIQIIGRATRDSENKEHSQFTNLILEPDASSNKVSVSVNTMLKAISASLLMEQVLAPNVDFKSKKEGKQKYITGVINIKGYKEPSDKVKKIIETDLNDLKANMFQDENILKAAAGGADPKTLNKVLIADFIQKKYPNLTRDENEQLRQYFIANTLIKSGSVEERGNTNFVRMANQFYDLDNLTIDLIDSINPFQHAYEVMSKNITPRLLKAINNIIQSQKIEMTDGEAIRLWNEERPKFMKEHGRLPDINSINDHEKRLAEAIEYLKKRKRELLNKKKIN
jgi:superfamily II DNA or RNA helicase